MSFLHSQSPVSKSRLSAGEWLASTGVAVGFASSLYCAGQTALALSDSVAAAESVSVPAMAEQQLAVSRASDEAQDVFGWGLGLAGSASLLVQSAIAGKKATDLKTAAKPPTPPSPIVGLGLNI